MGSGLGKDEDNINRMELVSSRTFLLPRFIDIPVETEVGWVNRLVRVGHPRIWEDPNFQDGFPLSRE